MAVAAPAAAFASEMAMITVLSETNLSFSGQCNSFFQCSGATDEKLFTSVVCMNTSCLILDQDITLLTNLV